MKIILIINFLKYHALNTKKKWKKISKIKINLFNKIQNRILIIKIININIGLTALIRK